MCENDRFPPYLATKLTLGELDEAGVRACQDTIAYGRRMVRYMDQKFLDGEGHSSSSGA